MKVPSLGTQHDRLILFIQLYDNMTNMPRNKYDIIFPSLRDDLWVFCIDSSNFLLAGGKTDLAFENVNNK